MQGRLRRGQRLGRYELLSPVGEGGMASVWLARAHGSRGSEKLVALKTIKASLADDPLFERWFLDEARIAQRIFHSNVAATLDLGEEDGVLFLVMEWIDGDSLGRIRRAYQRATGKALPIPIALRIVSDMCKGLHAAHELTDEHGVDLHVVHRDVSPNNVLVAGNGAVKIIDFGVATARDRTSPETTLGLIRGKAHYVAPEQIHRRSPLDRRCDVWAAGVCLYELASGTLPFQGKDSDETLRKILSATSPPSFDGDASVDEILSRSLAPYPQDRFSTASEMHRAIESLLARDGNGATEADVAAFVANELPRLAEERRAWITATLRQTGEVAEGVTAGSEPARGARRVGKTPGKTPRHRWVVAGALGSIVLAGGAIATAIATRPSAAPPTPTPTLVLPVSALDSPAPPIRAVDPSAPAAKLPPDPVVVPRIAEKKPAPHAGTKKPRVVSSTKAVSSSSPKERDVGF